MRKTRAKFDIKLQEALDLLYEVRLPFEDDPSTQVQQEPAQKQITPQKRIVQMLLSDQPQSNYHPGGVLFLANRIDAIVFNQKGPGSLAIQQGLTGKGANRFTNALSNIILKYPITEAISPIPGILNQIKNPLTDIFGRLKIVSKWGGDSRIESTFREMIVPTSGTPSPFVKIMPSEDEIQHIADSVISHINRIIPYMQAGSI